MAVAYERIKEFDREEEQNFTYIVWRRYRVGSTETLSGVSLEEGDTLPDDATYLIMESRVVEDMDETKHNTAKVIEVRAEKPRIWA